MLRFLFFFDTLRRLRRTVQTRALVRLAVTILVVVLASSLAFWLVEGATPAGEEMSFLDALWWSLVTMSTVGYGDLYPQTTAGRFIVALPVMLVGGAVLGYAISVITTVVMEGKTRELRGMNQLDLEGHTIVIHFPGEAKLLELVEELRNGNRQGGVVLVSDQIETLPESLAERDLAFVRGSPISAEALGRACVRRARHAIVLAPRASDEASDTSNLGVLVSLKDACPDLPITVECVNYARRELMRKAGADNVICVNELEVEMLVQASEGLPIQEFVRDLTSSLTPQRLDAVRFDAAGRGPVPFHTLLQEMAGKDLLLVGTIEGGRPSINPGRDHVIEDGATLLVVSEQRPTAYRGGS